MRSAETIEIVEIPASFSVDSFENGDNSILPASIQSILKTTRRPTIFRGFDLGPCTKTWTPQYLQAVCPEKNVKVHRSPVPNLDFRAKNFKYDTIPFSQLISVCSSQKKESESTQEYLYLRSLGDDPR